MPILRIARHIRTEQGVLIRTEELTSMIVAPGETKKIKFMKKTLKTAQTEEPGKGWQLETRGTDSNWHPWKD